MNSLVGKLLQLFPRRQRASVTGRRPQLDLEAGALPMVSGLRSVLTYWDELVIQFVKVYKGAFASCIDFLLGKWDSLIEDLWHNSPILSLATISLTYSTLDIIPHFSESRHTGVVSQLISVILPQLVGDTVRALCRPSGLGKLGFLCAGQSAVAGLLLIKSLTSVCLAFLQPELLQHWYLYQRRYSGTYVCRCGHERNLLFVVDDCFYGDISLHPLLPDDYHVKICLHTEIT